MPTRSTNALQPAKRVNAWLRGQQLPLWPADVRCAPNEFLRSALFTARNRNQKRRRLWQETLMLIGSGRITYTGDELRQDDGSVWLAIVQLARDTPLGERVEFTPYSLCKMLGWAPGGPAYKHLFQCLTRLQATSLAFYAERTKTTLSFSMLPRLGWRDMSNEGPPDSRAIPRYWVSLSKELVQLFGRNHFTYLLWHQRQQLPEGLSTWLHGYFASHKSPYPLAIKDVATVAGLSFSRPDNLRSAVKRALNDLVAVHFLRSWTIEDGYIHVVRDGRPDAVLVDE